MEKIVAGFESQFSQMQSKQEREQLLEKILVENWDPRVLDQTGLAQPLPRDHDIHPENTKLLRALSVLAKRHGLEDSIMNITSDRLTERMHPGDNPWAGPLPFLPCANANIRLHNKCPNAGVKTCGGCRLVSYCTNVCQTEHWRTHKKDCKNGMNHVDWIPRWIAENRDPSFSKAGAGGDHRPAGLKQKLLGNIPAIDVLKLEQNEGLQYKKDLSLVFAASGDLRDVVLSINAIPANYPGRISITVNDPNPYVTARNLLIILAIARVKSTALAADIALHLWYSAFIPLAYSDRIVAFMLPALSTIQGGRMDWSSGKLRVIGDLPPILLELLMSYYHQHPPLDREVATGSYLKAMFSPNRGDELDLYLCKLKPAHRLAIKVHREYGLLLPFGAVKSAFDTPNVTLFIGEGEWLQEDFASPLAGWDIPSVISVGKAHGVTEEDLFGCLYFYLSEQLAKFKEQLSKLNVTFYLSDMDSPVLSKEIMARSLANTIEPPLYPAGLPTMFDRIIVSNIVEKRSVGYERTLSDWGPLLNADNPSATVLSYTKFWHFDHPYEQNEKKSDQNMHRFLQEKGRLIPRLNETKFANVVYPTHYTVVAMVWHCASPAMYDDSDEFEKYLVAQGLYKSMKELQLHMKVKHTITPKRSGIPLSAPLRTLPKFKDDNEWYIKVLLSREGFLVRFQEFSRNTK